MVMALASAIDVRLSAVRCGCRQILRQASPTTIAQFLGFCRLESVNR